MMALGTEKLPLAWRMPALPRRFAHCHSLGCRKMAMQLSRRLGKLKPRAFRLLHPSGMRKALPFWGAYHAAINCRLTLRKSPA